MRVLGVIAALLTVPLYIALTTTYVHAAQATFSGTYTTTTEDGPATLTLKQDAAGNITGILKVGGESGTFKGRLENGLVTGTATYGGASLPFSLIRDERGLRLRLGEGEDELVFPGSSSAIPKSTPSSPGGKPGGGTITAAPKAKSDNRIVEAKSTPVAANVPAGWKTYRNPVGLSFRYPESWKMTDINGLLLLVPPGAEAPAGGMPSEIYNVVGMPAPGISRVDDPRLMQMADSMVGQMFPYMRRSGNGEAVMVGGMNGLIVTYDGNNPTTGKPSRIRSYALIYKGFLLQVQAWGDRDKVAARDALLRQIYRSFTPGPSQHDTQIVGNWAGGETSNDRVRNGIDGRIASSLASQSSSSYRLMPDGSLLALTVSRSSVAIRSSSTTPESQRVDALLDTGDQQQWKKGRWYAGNGKIVVILEDGTGMSADYQVVGGALIVRFAGGTTMRYTRY
jgi:hypothetical protein